MRNVGRVGCDGPARRGFGAGGDKRASIEVRLAELGGLGVEYGEDLLAGIVVSGGGVAQPADRALVATHQVGVDELLFAVEVVVERGTGYAGVFDDAVDTDGVDALGVEELVGGSEEPVTGWRRAADWMARGDGEGHDAARFQESLVMVTRSA